MPATAWIPYTSGKLKVHNSTIDLDSDALKVAIFSSAYTPSIAHTTFASQSSNEIAAVNGYSAGGASVTGSVSDAGGGKVKFDITDPQYTASGGDISGRYAILHDVTTGDLLAYSLLDDTPADVTVTNGNTMTFNINAAGVWDV